MNVGEEFTAFYFTFPRQSINKNIVENTAGNPDSASPLLKALTEKLILL
jgi:hypothetical protein